jgi:hypothetical protein
MRVLIFKEIDTADHGVGGFRIGAVDIPDTTAAAAVPDTAMRMFQQQAGGSIADGVYWPVKASEAFRRRSTEQRSSRITAETNIA